MKKKMIAIGCLALSCTFAFGACSGNTGTQGGETQYAPSYTGGTHIFNEKERTDYIVQNGRTDYALLYPEHVDASESAAVQEFTDLFYKATGITLERVSDAGISYSPNAKYISFGETVFAKESGVSVKTAQKPVKGNGYLIKTVGNSIVVQGGQSIGTLFGAYELLTRLVGYKCYGVDCYAIEKNVKNLKMRDFDILDNPDIDQRLANYGVIYNDESLAHKLRFQLQYAEVYMNPTRAIHNAMEYIPKDKFGETHPDWYANGDTQLCYTAHGKEEEYQTMVRAVADAMIPFIEAEPQKRIISLSQEDNFQWCTCDSCLKLYAKYGTDAASNIMFVNDVADTLEDWRKENCPDRELTIATFAYYRTETPPAKRNEKGEWKPIDEKVIARDNVTVLYAPLALMNFNHGIDDSENADIRNILDGWAACSKNIAVWNYQTHFGAYFMPYDTFSSCREQYRKYIGYGATWIFDQGQQNNGNSTGFSMLKLYLNSQWGWDINREYNVLVDDFFEHYFGAKEGAMRTFYEELRTWCNYLDAQGNGGKCSDSWEKAALWPERLVKQWIGYCEEAYEEIEVFKQSDMDAYEMLKRHIDIESMMPRYMMLKFYSGTYSDKELANARRSFARDCTALGFTKVSEQGDISGFIGSW